MSNIPDPQAVLRELAPTLELVQGALEWGTLQTREYFDSLDLRPDSDLAPNIVRFHAKRTLATTKSNHTTLGHSRVPSLPKSPLPPFVKGGRCHRSSCV